LKGGEIENLAKGFVCAGSADDAGETLRVRDSEDPGHCHGPRSAGEFLELILLELKNARIVESVRGAKGGYQLRRPPSEIALSEIIRLVDGPLAPFGDAEQLRSLIASDAEHSALYEVFLKVRDSAAKILESTTVADLVGKPAPSRKRLTKKKREKEPALSIVERGAKSG